MRLPITTRRVASPLLGIALLASPGSVIALPGAPVPEIASLTPATAVGSALTLTIEGTGFGPGSAVEVRQADGARAATGTVTGLSPTRIVTTVALAGASPGRYEVVAIGAGGVASKPVVLTLVPEVRVSPSSGPPGTPFTYSGRGFKGNFSAISHLEHPDGLEWQAKRYGTSAEGTFERVIESGELTPGTYTVWALDDDTKTPTARATFTVVAGKGR